MKIEVLGTGCAKCGRLEEHVRQAVRRAGIDAEIAKVTELRDILTHDVLGLPALLVDGAVVVSGRVPGVEELSDLLGTRV